MVSIITFILLLFFIYVVFILASLIFYLLEGNFPNYSVRIMPYFRLINYNQLYKCSQCNCYFRQYQSKLYAASVGLESRVKCPHCKCDNGYSYSSIFIDRVENPPKYLNTHLSCPKLKGFKELFAMKKSIKLYKEKNKTDNNQKDFEQFQKKTQDDPLKWLKNIQGDDKL